MSDVVRVRLDSGVEKNVGAEFAEANDLKVLDEPTHNGDGTPRKETRSGGRPNKPKTSVAKEAAAKAPEPVAEVAEEAK